MPSRGRNRLVKVAHFLLWVLLVGQLAFFVLAVTETRIPLPQFILDSTRKAMLKKGLNIDFKGTFTVDGNIHYEDILLRTTNKKVPALIAIDHALIKIKPWYLIIGKLHVSKIEVQRAEALFTSRFSPNPS